MNGLNTINANAVFTDTLEVNTLTIDIAGTVPTRPNGDSTTNIANTQFVSNAITTAGANYVDLTSTQTITGEKTFSNANTVVSGNLITNSIRSASATTDINIGQNLTTGDINMGTTFIGPTMNIALNWGSTSNSGQLSLAGGSFNLLSSGVYTQRSGPTFGTTISDTQSSGIMNIATLSNRSGTININTGGTSTAPINISSGTNTNAPITIGSTASTTQTCAMDAITTFSKIPSCAVAPTTANHLCNKTYVDSVAGAVSLGGVNVWTNENDFTNIVKVKDPTLATYAGIDFFSSITPGIVMNGSPGTTSALSGVNLNTNTLTVPIKNNQSLIRMRIPMNIAGFGVPSFYFGQLDIIFNSITAITILKNGSFYKTVSVFNLLNFTGTTKSWTGWSQKGENARAYVGDVQFELEITTANTSVDTYTIGIAMDVAVNAGAVGLITPRFLCTGDFNFTTTHATTTTGTTYISTDPASFFPYQIDYGDEGNYIIGKGDTYVKTIQGGKFTIDALSQVDIASSGSDVNIKTGIDGGDLNLQSLGGSVNINTTGTLTTNIGIGGGTTNITGTTNISGTTNINASGAVNTNIGNTSSTTYLNGTTVQDINGTFNMMPTATIIQNVSATVPSGFLYCNGQAVNRVGTYARLFASIGTTFGPGNGTTTFNVPNFQGAFLRGAGNQTAGTPSITYTAGAVGTAQQDAVLNPLYASNQGFFNLASGSARQCPARAIIGTDPVDTTTGILPRFDRTATENRPFNHAVYYYIRY
jgi:hypothetical protein